MCLGRNHGTPRREEWIRGTVGRWRMKWEEEGENGQSQEEIKFTIWEGGYISSVPYQAMDDVDARTAGFCTMSILTCPTRPVKVGEEGGQQLRGGLITFFSLELGSV